MVQPVAYTRSESSPSDTARTASTETKVALESLQCLCSISGDRSSCALQKRCTDCLPLAELHKFLGDFKKFFEKDLTAQDIESLEGLYAVPGGITAEAIDELGQNAQRVLFKLITGRELNVHLCGPLPEVLTGLDELLFMDAVFKGEWIAELKKLVASGKIESAFQLIEASPDKRLAKEIIFENGVTRKYKESSSHFLERVAEVLRHMPVRELSKPSLVFLGNQIRLLIMRDVSLLRFFRDDIDIASLLYLSFLESLPSPVRAIKFVVRMPVDQESTQLIEWLLRDTLNSSEKNYLVPEMLNVLTRPYHKITDSESSRERWVVDLEKVKRNFKYLETYTLDYERIYKKKLGFGLLKRSLRAWKRQDPDGKAHRFNPYNPAYSSLNFALTFQT